MNPEHLVRLARATRNRGRCHVFLGHAWSDDADKTTVEPGNGTSPGVWTCGISLWTSLPDGTAITPDALPDSAIAWELDPPVIRSRYAAGAVAIEHETTQVGDAGTSAVDHHRIAISAGGATASIVVRGEGPAGGRIGAISWDVISRALTVAGSARLVFDAVPEDVRIEPAGDGDPSPIAVVSFAASSATDAFALAFRVEHGFAGRAAGTMVPVRAPAVDPDPFATARARWRAELPATISAPDPRIQRAWSQCAYHLLAACERGTPRIGAVNYPALWLRDGVIVARAFDLIGRHDLGRSACEHLAPLVFSGGFGAEADAPGEGIWALVRHAAITADVAWLSRMRPAIAERVAWIGRMRACADPVHAVGHNRIPAYLSHPAINLVCRAADAGLVRGRMDWHDPDFYINAWCCAGLRCAGEAARALGDAGGAAALAADAAIYERQIAERLLPRFGNERDPACTPWPTGCVGDSAPLRAAFAAWYRAHRLDIDGRRRAEPLWTYFEAAQAHNALLLGLRDEAWTTLDGMLAPWGTWDVAAHHEGQPTGNELLPFGNGAERRGWLSADALGGNMPHNWTTAELIACLRDVFVREEGDHLVIGDGVPRAWLRPGSSFGCTAMPTERGTVTWHAQVDGEGAITIAYDGPLPYRSPLTSRSD